MSQKNPQRRHPSQTAAITVEVMSGPEDGREIICNRLPIIIGRSGENTVGISCDHLISRNHARINRSQKGFVLEDLKSTNGTFIENKRVRKATLLEPEQLFRVGATLLRLRVRPANKSSN